MECGGHGFLQIYCVCLFRIANRRRKSETQNGVFLIYTAFGISDDPCFSKLRTLRGECPQSADSFRTFVQRLSALLNKT